MRPEIPILSGHLSRREFLFILAGIWLPFIPTDAPPKTPEAPSLNLKIDKEEWRRLIRQRVNWEFLPDATNKNNLMCPSWAPNICMGKISSLFRIAVNKPVAEFMFTQASGRQFPIKTDIVLIEDWGQKEGGEGHQAGFTALVPGIGEQIIILWLKFAAWYAIKNIEANNLPLEEYFAGFASYYLSEWAVHEMAHAGAERRAFGSRLIPPNLEEPLHKQIFDFQRQYADLFREAGREQLAENALVFALEPQVSIRQIRDLLSAESRLYIK